MAVKFKELQMAFFLELTLKCFHGDNDLEISYLQVTDRFFFFFFKSERACPKDAPHLV